MSKRIFGFEGFGINRQATYNFDRSRVPQRLSVPLSSRRGHDNYEDTVLNNIDHSDNDNFKDEEDPTSIGNGAGDDEIDPLYAFIEGIQEDLPAAPGPKPKKKAERFKDDDDDDPVWSFLRAEKGVGLTLAADALHAGYDSDEEVYAAAKAVDAGMLELAFAYLITGFSSRP